MDNLIAAGRLLFAIPIGAFGVQYIIYGRFMGGLPPVPPWTPGGPVFAYMTGIVLIAISLSILSMPSLWLLLSHCGFRDTCFGRTSQAPASSLPAFRS